MLGGKTALAILGLLLFIGGGFLGVRVVEEMVMNSYRNIPNSPALDKELEKRMQEIVSEENKKAEAHKNVLIRNEAYFTALKKRDGTLMRRLQKQGASASLAMCQEEITPAEATRLLKEGVRLDYKDDTGMTALENHVYFANVPMVRWLLAHKASPKVGSPDWLQMVARKREQINSYTPQHGVGYQNEVTSLKVLEAADAHWEQRHQQFGHK